MRRTYRPHRPQVEHKEFKVNEKIMAPRLMVIDENGANLGDMDRAAALRLAREREFDLIEVSPKANPPIAKIMDYGSYKYQKEKQERKQKAKSKTVEIKTIKLSLRIGDHDMEVRAHQALKFMKEGDKVKIEMQLRGRENQHADLAAETIKEMIAKIQAMLDGKEVRIEQAIIKQGNRFSTIIYS